MHPIFLFVSLLGCAHGLPSSHHVLEVLSWHRGTLQSIPVRNSPSQNDIGQIAQALQDAVSLRSSGPSLVPFNLLTDVVSQTGHGYAKVGNSFPIDTTAVYTNSTFAVDLVNQRMIVDAGIFGVSYFLPNATYVTFPNSSTTFGCGYANYSWISEVNALKLLNNKGGAIALLQNAPFFAPVTTFSGFASDNTQCSSAIAYEWQVDNNKGVRKILADVPIIVPGTNGSAPQVVKQYYEYDSITYGTPAASLFALPAICTAAQPLPWCLYFFGQPICAYAPGTFGV